ncbi:formimidoylglutamate deiminase [Curtobacterium ammoniigenes]|uniref:formimidoylglutamate deiminase n=1 Tax=Curtobacterium ammoniigenes TaxID=395387 RepID=UPI0009FA8C7A|nr:formimidoylglutamate deiminase [Curtobacterium ammoniigenes]
MRPIHASTALIDGTVQHNVRIVPSADGMIASVIVGAEAGARDLRFGHVVAGAANAHSHAFHRLLRGRTHGNGGDFWQWRTAMYRAAACLDPDGYHRVATAVFAEMLTAGWTSVGEFHYVHHQTDGRPYPSENAMGEALIAAAADVSIRLTLLDTCYLHGAPNRPLAREQRRFGDGSVDAWLDRWHELRALVDRSPATPGTRPDVLVGAAIHSVRAVAPDEIARIIEALHADVPVHIHLSEQIAENTQSAEAYGMRPTAVLDRAGALSPRLSVVHATHVRVDEIALLGAAGVTAVLCPTTESDLGDGIGPARALADAGARLALGSDQNAVIDPFLETRGLEYGERLAGNRRGVLTLPMLDAARSSNGARSLGRIGGIAPGAPCDLVEVRETATTIGAEPDQVALVASAADVGTVIVGGRVVAESGLLADGRDPAELLRVAFRSVPTGSGVA